MVRHGIGGWVGAAAGLVLAAASAIAGAQPAAPENGEGEKPGEGFIPPEVHVCLGCHTVDKARHQGAGAAPPLWGIMGRAPSVDGVQAGQWDTHALDRWLANPRAVDPDTTSRFPGYADAATREAVIRFLGRLQ